MAYESENQAFQRSSHVGSRSYKPAHTHTALFRQHVGRFCASFMREDQVMISCIDHTS